jgi:autotransporter translocation and assembly factor TamB
VNGEFELTGKAPESSGEKSGLDFTAGGVLEDGNLNLGRSRFETEFANVVLSGDYPRRGPANLRLGLDARDLSRADEVQQALRTLLHPERPARRLQIAGRGRASGSLTGRLPRMRFEGDFAGSSVHFREIRLDNVDARGSLNAEAVHFESLRAAKEDASFLGRGELSFGSVPPSDWAIAGEAGSWPAADLQALLSLPVWLEGKLSGDASFISRDHQLGGEGTFRVDAGSLRGRSFDRADARLELSGREIILDPISVTREDGRIKGRLQFDLEADGLEGRLTVERYPIAELLPNTVNAKGHMDAEIGLGGSLQQPLVDVKASSPLLELSGLPLGSASLEALVREGAADGKLQIQGEHFELEAQSQIQLSPDYAFTGHTTWRGAELGGWIRSAVVGVPESLNFVTDGTADFRGNLSSLVETLSADVAMKKILLDTGDYQLALSTPVKMQVLNGAVLLDGLPLRGLDTELELSGRLPLGSSSLDVQVRGSVNLEIVRSIFPSVSSAGGVDLSARITGSWERPFMSGHAEIQGGTLRFQGFPQALGDLHGKVSFDNRTVRFPDVQARFGGAPVTLSGTMLLRGLGVDSLEVEARGSGLRLRYPEGLVATLDADLSLSGTSSSQILSGRVEVDEATWSREYDLTSGILASNEDDAFEILEEMGQQGPLSNLSFDIEILAPGTLRIRNSRATIDARAELELRGTFTHPALLGRAESLRGEVFLLGQRYRLVSGRVDFVDPAAVKPFFDLVAESRVRSYRVELRLSGTPERFFPELSSDPPLRTVDILRLLAGASERDILIGSEEEELAGVGVATLLTERLTQEVSRRAERLFGLDRFSIDPFLVGQFTNPTARVSIGKQIYRDLSVSYSTNLNEATETLILVEYTPEGPVSWILSRDEEGALGVDLRFRKSF